MRFSQVAPAIAGFAGLASATLPDVGLDLGLDLDLGLSPAAFDLGKSWDKEVIFNGVVGVDATTSQNVELGLELVEAQLEGSVSLNTLGDFLLAPNIRLGLEGVKAFFQIDFSATAATYYTVELVSSGELGIDTGLLDVDLGAAFALDLVVGAAAAVDLSAGFYVSFAAGDYIDVSALTKEVVDSDLSGIVAQALPVSVGADVDLSAQIEVQFGLRLRSHVTLDAELEILGLDILDAGADVAIWVDLVSQTMILVELSDCPISIDNQFAFRLGIAVNLDVQVLDILDLSLAPEITVQLAQTEKQQVCLGGGDDDEDPTSAVSSISSSAAASSSASATATITISTVSTSSSTNGTWTTSSAASASEAVSTVLTTAPAVTSTVSSTQTYTITSCHASVPNCPADQTQVIVTSTIVSSVTVCPEEGETTAAPISSSSTSKPVPVHTITETATTVVPCEPTTSTYTPPPPPATPIEPTLTITVCPSTSAPSGTPSVSVPSVTGVPSVTHPVSTGPVITGPIVTGPIVSHPAPNSTWASITVPSSTGGITPTSPPPGVTSAPPPVAAAGSIRVGMALAMPAVVAMFL